CPLPKTYNPSSKINNCKMPTISNPEAPFSAAGNKAPEKRKPVYNNEFATSVVRHQFHLYRLYHSTTQSQKNNNGVKSTRINIAEPLSVDTFLFVLLIWKKERINKNTVKINEYPHNAVCSIPHL